MHHHHSSDCRGVGVLAAVLVTLSLSTGLQAETLADSIPRLMELGDIPGLSVAVVRADSVSWSGAFGVRDRRSGGDVDEQTVFEAASLGKTLFSYVTLRLVDRGIIDLDTPLVQYASYQRLAADPRHRRVTARMCLCHTTGLPNWGTSFVAEPGSRFTYSGEGILFLRTTLESVTGLSLEDLARQEAFEPLGMTSSSYLWRQAYATNHAAGHDNQGRPQPRRRCPGGSAAASLHTTARDYARFLEACLSGEGLSPASHAKMIQSQTQADLGGSSTVRDHVGWSLGWGTMDGADGELIWQWGDNGDTVALAVGDPGTGDGLVYLANSATGLSVAHELMAAVLPERPWCLETLGYQRYNGPKRVKWCEAQVRRAIQTRDWARAGSTLETLLDLRPDHQWAGVKLEEIQARLAQGGQEAGHS